MTRPTAVRTARQTPAPIVWDRVVRIFHWSTVASFATAYLSSDAKWLHERAGYVILALVPLRILWGFIGTRHARFADFVRTPRDVLAYLAAFARGRAPAHRGHNPAGDLMILALLAMLLIVAVSGWMSETDRWFGVPWVDHLHHMSAHLLLAFVCVHVAGVALGSWAHRENLILAMITGRKPANVSLGQDPGQLGPETY